jgi:hypothetical protein
MVGQITYMPGGEAPEILPLITPSANTGTTESPNPPDGTAPSEGEPEETEPATAPPQKAAELPSMRDPFRTVFGGLTALERMFLESKQRVEVIMHPLAIYRETLLPSSEID